MLCNYFYHKMSISKVPLKPGLLFVVRNTVQSEEGLTEQDLKKKTPNTTLERSQVFSDGTCISQTLAETAAEIYVTVLAANTKECILV